ncbi:sensor histidine kinase [Kineococcus rhizosphaerae]|uniref:Two-component system sensor histidine kinase DesK n=1 Tax=Kineococcus rhizosphaerae TaxID=559628 RepID=A0A2T0R817_9ACTN|nr:histidine kinase [Kineococcus rhizosphaerae]PRY17313.1 two-component system sensor histidine kinase DesK [Kineococcus rhizosphaerae]
MPPPERLPAMLVPRMRGAGFLFAGVWLLILVQTVEDAWANPDRELGLASIAATAVFGATYFLLLSRGWARMRSSGKLGVSAREAVLGLLVLVALTALVVPGAGTSGFNTVYFVCAYAAFALPVRPALAVFVVLIGGVALLGRFVPGWSDLEGTAIGSFFAAVATLGTSRLIARGRQLAAAQQDLARLAVTEERARFSRDLHDLLGHSLTVITLKAELAGRLLDVDVDRARTEVADVERLARTALTDVRAALEGYREVSLGTEVAGARQALAAAGITANLPGSVEEVPAEAQELFGWAVREGVTNVVRHSGARTCWVSVSSSCVVVADDGCGPRPGVGGSGLAGLSSRAKEAGAAVTVGRSEHGGFELAVRR